MQDEPKIIDHNPDERRPTNGIWWVAWGIVALLWIGQIYLDGWGSIKWDQIGLGAGTALILTIWGIEISDNKVPSWMVPRPKKRYFPPPIPGSPATGPNGKTLFVVVPATIAIIGAFIWLRF